MDKLSHWYTYSTVVTVHAGNDFRLSPKDNVIRSYYVTLMEPVYLHLNAEVHGDVNKRET